MQRALQIAIVLVATLALAARCVAQPAAPAGPMPTSPELHKLFDDGQHQALLQKLPRVLALKGPAAQGYDMVDLNLLKADTYVQIKQQNQAVTAVNDAIRAVTKDTDPQLAALARAQLMLLKQSPGLAYKPRAEGAKPIPLAEMAQRKAAYAALLADLQSEVAKRVKAAEASKSLPPIIAAVQGLADMGAVELAATGSDAKTQAAGGTLAAGAQSLMTDALNTMGGRVAVIDREANELMGAGVQTVNRSPSGGSSSTVVASNRFVKRGLSVDRKEELRGIMDTCDRIRAACHDFKAVSKEHAAGFRTVADLAFNTGEKARRTAVTDYTGFYGR